MMMNKKFFGEIWFESPGHPRQADEVICLPESVTNSTEGEELMKRMIPHAYHVRAFVLE